MRTVTANQIKKLPVGTDVFRVHNETGEKVPLVVVKSGRYKVLVSTQNGGQARPYDIAGWHYEVFD